jgi:uncharacterized repeat protein (TIGR01451 family)
LRKLTSYLLFAVSIVFISISAAPLQAQESDLMVLKSGPDESAADTDVPFTVTVTNFGPDDASSVVLTDVIPTGMTFVSATQDNGPAFFCTTPTFGDTTGSIDCSIATMTAGTAANFTFVFHIGSGTPDGTTFTNVASVSTATFDPNSENDAASATTTTPFPPQADMGVQKEGPAGAGPDTDVTYTIALANGGPDDASNVLLEDLLQGTTTFVSLMQDNGPPMSCASPSVGSGGTVSCSLATFPAGATATFTLTVHIDASTASGTVISNTATVTSDQDPNEENDASSTLLTVSAADVTVVKSGPATADAGTQVSYTLVIMNNGPDTAFDVTLDDALPAGTTFVSLTHDSGALGSCTTPPFGTNGTTSCNFPSLGNTATAQYTLVVEVGDATALSNTATVSATGADSDPTNNSSTFDTTVTQVADLSAMKSGPSAVNAGSNATYAITVSNGGPSAADNVSLTDTLPPNTTFVSLDQTSGPTFACAPPAVGATGTITCTLSTFDPDASATFDLIVAIDPTTPNGTSIANTANISSSTNDPNSANDASMTTATANASADVAVTKTGAAAVEANTDLTYTITVTNNGPSDASTIVLTDAVPTNTTFVSFMQNGGPSFACVPPPVGGTGSLNCTLTTLVPGNTATFSFVVHVTASTPNGTIITNTANVSTTTPDPISANDSATATANVAAVADLVVTKSGPSSIDADSDITYVITLTNEGPSDATTVTLTDPLPPQTTFVSLTQTTGPTFACTAPAVGANGTVTCTIATLAADATASFNLVLHVAPQAQGTLTNTATVTSPSDPTPANNAGASAAAISAIAVPTLSPLALGLFGLALAGIALFVQRR